MGWFGQVQLELRTDSKRAALLRSVQQGSHRRPHQQSARTGKPGTNSNFNNRLTSEFAAIRKLAHALAVPLVDAPLACSRAQQQGAAVSGSTRVQLPDAAFTAQLWAEQHGSTAALSQRSPARQPSQPTGRTAVSGSAGGAALVPVAAAPKLPRKRPPTHPPWYLSPLANWQLP